MNRILIASAIAAAAAAVSVPAVAGLANNPSFSHRLPVNVPSEANVVLLDDHGKVVDKRHGADDPTSTRVPSPHRSGPGESEPGDDRGGATDVRTGEPGDDRGASTEPGDDRGRESSEPGDDRGRESSEPGDDRDATTEPGDDSGGKGGHGGDDGGHGGDDGGQGGEGGHGGDG